eukprot:Colp12_sorted_trinity150504_noHs@15036
MGLLRSVVTVAALAVAVGIGYYETQIRVGLENGPIKATKARTVLIPLPEKGFDPTEVAVPWKILTDLGHKVVFATPRGICLGADPHVLQGFTSLGLLSAQPSVVAIYNEMIKSQEYTNSIMYENIRINDYDGLILPGGHHPEMDTMLRNSILSAKISSFWLTEKPVGAICHGVLLLSRATHPHTRQSLLHNKNTTAVPAYLERLGYIVTKYAFSMGNYQLSTTWPLYVEGEVVNALESESQWIRGPLDPLAVFFPGTLNDHKHAFVVEDGHYLSARFWGDAYLFALRFALKLQSMP